jgi:hypothetical protein
MGASESCHHYHSKCRRVVLNSVISYFTKLQDYTKLWNFTQSGSAFVPTQSRNFAPSPYLKALKKIIIQIKVAYMPITFYCAKLHLSKCNSS